MKFLQLTAMLVLSSFIFAQSAPEGAFSTLHVQAEDPQEYIDYLKENTEAFEAIGLEEYMATAMEFEKAVKAEGNDFNLGIFQPFGGGYSEQVFHVRGSHANSEDAGDIIDKGYAGAASTALYLKLLSLADEVVTDTYESCQIIYTAD